MQSLSNPIKHSACSVTDVLCALERGEEMNPPFTSLQVMALDDDGRTAFHWACAQRMMVAAQYLASHAHNIATLVNQKDEDSWTPLHSAASAGHVDVVEFLLQNGAKVDATTNEGRTPLFYAASKNHDLVVQLLLHNHADPRIADKNGATLVHRAASAGHIRILEILFSAKVKVNAKDRYGETPLHVAAAAGNADVCTLLIAHGADVDVTNTDGLTASDLAPDSTLKRILGSRRDRQAD